MPAKQNFIVGHEYDLGDGTTAVWSGKKGWVSAEEYLASKGEDQTSFDDKRALVQRLERVKQHAQKFGATGAIARLTSGQGLPEWSPFKGIGGTPGYNLDAEVTPVRSNFFIQNLSKMRQNSPTGAAVGNVTEKEGTKIESTNGILDVGQSKNQFLQEVADTEAAMARHQPGLYASNPFTLTEDNRADIPQNAYFKAGDGRLYRNQKGAGFPGRAAQQPKQPVRVSSAEEARALPPGTVFMTPDGRTKVR